MNKERSMSQKDKLIMGTPYVVRCPQCSNLIVTSVMWGSGACSCEKCSPNEILHIDYVSREDVKRNHKMYADILKDYL